MASCGRTVHMREMHTQMLVTSPRMFPIPVTLLSHGETQLVVLTNFTVHSARCASKVGKEGVALT
jgi:hypothetical protein